jgi:hypothetical protein
MKKRILVLLTVVAMMMVMLAMSVALAFASPNPNLMLSRHVLRAILLIRPRLILVTTHPFVLKSSFPHERGQGLWMPGP